MSSVYIVWLINLLTSYAPRRGPHALPAFPADRSSVGRDRRARRVPSVPPGERPVLSRPTRDQGNTRLCTQADAVNMTHYPHEREIFCSYRVRANHRRKDTSRGEKGNPGANYPRSCFESSFENQVSRQRPRVRSEPAKDAASLSYIESHGGTKNPLTLIADYSNELAPRREAVRLTGSRSVDEH